MNRIVILIFTTMWYSFLTNTTFAFDRQDTLRGSNGKGRSWWDVQHYELAIRLNIKDQSISGSNKITAKVVASANDSLQLDLQNPLMLDSVIMNGKHLSFVREGNAWWLIHNFSQLKPDDTLQLTAYWHGKPRIATRPPWDGGFIWTKDTEGNPWLAVACQGLGASSWWACKDYQGDEPDLGMTIKFPCTESDEPVYCHNDSLIVVSNGKQPQQLIAPENSSGNSVKKPMTLSSTNEFHIVNPINIYSTTFYIGDYISWNDTLMGANGRLDLSFYALRHNEAKARKQFAIAKEMLHCFEYWMGPYPFYQDGYKLVEAPYLGMEHQSAVAYGNEYKMGYRGMDRSGTGVGLLFDFIIVHESGHEWFGNNITAQDVADNWLHEGFTTYTEALFTECAFGKEKAFEYTRGQWKGIRNDKPVIGHYGVHNEGSGDEYDKGSAVVHMIRTIINNDERFRQLLRSLNKDFYHKTVTSEEVERYISRFANYNFTPLFNQYLRTTDIPEFDYYFKKKQLFFRFKKAVEGFTLPIAIQGEKKQVTIYPTSEWQSIKWNDGYGFEISQDFLIGL